MECPSNTSPSSWRKIRYIFDIRHFVECKRSKTDVDLALRYLKKRFSQVTATQIVLEGDLDVMTRENIRVCSAHHFLKEFA
jgi:hypothetical protein